ncbi:hypothetical protein MMC19_004722 [Ptychographa xylographoides]|nr:hypothetical protein [Ptychographa xylographoides]
MTSSIKLRPPTTGTSIPSDISFTPPTIEWLSGGWHVTHSTLPMWKSSRNVKITYTPLPQTQNGQPQLEDVVTHQPLKSSKTKTIAGIDTYSASHIGAWDWRGKGLLKIASSHWEVLGYGETEGGGQWVVTYFAKTLFTPAGIDVYSRAREGLRTELLEQINNALCDMEDPVLAKLVEGMFEVTRN